MENVDKSISSNNNATGKVNEIIEKVKQKNSILLNEELVRGTQENINLVVPVSKTSKLSGNISIFSTSDSIMGVKVETFPEFIQCNLYEEIKEEMEAKLEEERLNNPQKIQERNYTTMKKVIFFNLV